MDKHGGKEFIGKVVSVKMQKTAVVEVSQIFSHPLYKKTVKRNRRYAVHSENSEIKNGDIVRIKETKPMSKTVHFNIVTKLSD